MSISMSDLQSLPLSYATCSIGCSPAHTLPKRLVAISDAGFQGIELAFPDIIDFGKSYLKYEVDSHDYDSLCTVAKAIKSLCHAQGLKIMMLQPFANFEGWEEGSMERKDAFERAEGWIRIMEAVGCDMLQVGSSDSPNEKIGTDRSRFVNDLRKLADMLAEKNFNLAYENWCWSTHAPTWLDVWEIVQAVDRPNIGLCLDTFQTAGYEWGDPTTSSGLLEDLSKDQIESRFRSSMKKLSQTVPKEKVYLLQISDAYKPPRPMSTEPDETGLRPRGRWSHDFRPLPFNGGYLPVVDVARAVLKTGFRGWFSYEVFDSGPDGNGTEYDLQAYAKRAMEAQQRLIWECSKG
ncbi:putative 3-dehydroshikimate dehydratase [Patellaria atrata CBS 101060]|uniref:3-dehydroshikimate dehydratase n=1 Tax=Patellaria atrata CBS 101060 TaxID=1346257 RepID=A0A9P4VT33_9PEZI|nr:putative 3-dehydroshikimate dehydratase [Patellaria atrata CBS 101060]